MTDHHIDVVQQDERVDTWHASARWTGIGLFAAVAFVLAASVRLDSQGLYYDELHQATAAFAYKGAPSELFTELAVNDVPVLNMTYSGALKSGIYGSYLRLCNAEFSILSWRLAGILIVASGILLFSIIGGPRLGLGGLLIFLFLVVTDMTVLLATRHDWGPVALALFLRFLFIAVWLRNCAEPLSIRSTFLLAVIIGVSVFEKLSAVVLLPAFAFLLFSFGETRQSLRHWMACIVGGLTGALPLVFANVWSFIHFGDFISLRSLQEDSERVGKSMGEFINYLIHSLAMGSGFTVKNFILGVDVRDSAKLEVGVLSLVLLIAGILALRHWKDHVIFRRSGVMILCYGLTVVSIFLLPKFVRVHHWIIATPFHYAAIALLVLPACKLAARDCLDRILRPALLAAVVLLAVFRFGFAVSTQVAFLQGKASPRWDPSLNVMGAFAGTHADDALFIAADWGVGTQMECFAGARPGVVRELFRNYSGPEEIALAADDAGKDVLYLVTKVPGSHVAPQNTAQIVADMEVMPGWQEVAVEPAIADLRSVRARKWIRHASTVPATDVP